MGVPVFYQGSKYKPGKLVTIPIPVVPQFSNAEIGNVNASTVAVTFDSAVVASGDDYSSGVTIKVNGSARSFESGIRQSNHAVVYYALALAVVNGDTVTWEYAKASGNIVAESDGVALEDVTAQAVTNNVSDPIGDALRADAVAYWKFDEASGTRIDATQRGNNAVETNGSISAVAGRVGNAAHFTGVEGVCLKCARSNDLVIDPTKDFYLATWAKLASKTDPHYFLFSEDTIGFNIEYFLSYEPTSEPADRIHFNYVVDSGAVTFGSPPVGQWMWIEIFYRVSDTKIGITVNNGVFDENLVVQIALYNNDTTLFFGDLDYGEYPLDGDIDETLIMHRLPTQDERDYLYNSGAGRALFPAP